MSDLDDLFAAARSEPSALPAPLSARILADADAVQAALVQSARPGSRSMSGSGARSVRAGLLARLVGAFGGGMPLAGGVLAGVAGLAIGYLQPEAFSGLSAVLASEAAGAGVELMPGFEALFTEE